MMKYLYPLSFLFLLLSPELYGQEELKYDISFNLVWAEPGFMFDYTKSYQEQVPKEVDFEKNKQVIDCKLLDPITYYFRAKNNSDSIIETNYLMSTGVGFENCVVFFQVRELGETIWDSIGIPINYKLRCFLGGGKSTTSFYPNSEWITRPITVMVHNLIPTAKVGKTYEIRSVWEIWAPNGIDIQKIASSTSEVKITKYEGTDRKCYHILKKLNEPDFIYFFAFGGGYIGPIGSGIPARYTKYIKEAQAIIDTYPNSRFAPYAAAILADSEFQKAFRVLRGREEDDLDALELLRSSLRFKKLAESYGNQFLNKRLDFQLDSWRYHEELWKHFEKTGTQIPKSIREEFGIKY